MSRQIMVGGVAVGGGAPVSIQSMCNTATEDEYGFRHKIVSFIFRCRTKFAYRAVYLSHFLSLPQ